MSSDAQESGKALNSHSRLWFEEYFSTCRCARRSWLGLAQPFSRFVILATLIGVATANVTNSFLLDSAFRDLPMNHDKWGLIATMNGVGARPFIYRALPAIGIKQLAMAIYSRRPASLSYFEDFEFHYHYFSKISDQDWTPVVSISYALMYFAVVLAMASTFCVLYRMSRFRGLTYTQGLGTVAAFSFILPFFFQRHGFYYDFFELLGVFAANYFFLRREMALSTLAVLATSFVKESFFLAPIALFFLHEDDTPKAERYAWFSVQLGLSIAGRLTIMSIFAHRQGVTVEHNFLTNLAFWIRMDLWIPRWQNAIAPAIFLPRLELYIVPALLLFGYGWKRSELRIRRYFVAAALPLVLLYIPFGYTDEFRVFFLACPAVALILFSAVPSFGEILGENPPLKKVVVNESVVQTAKVRSSLYRSNP